MREPARIRILPDGRRLHLHDGPIDLIVEANGAKRNVAVAYEAAARRFVSILKELCSELPLLRSQVQGNSRRPRGAVAQRMFAAIEPYADHCFVTPMAAVAGAVAETVLETMIAAAPLERAYVNNGGDIAMHLAPQESYRIGMVERPDHPSLFGTFKLSADQPIRGIATSGWRGRSFSLGIADAVTVLAETAAASDAAATVIANAVNLPDHPTITRAPAREISPDSDLGDLLVTRDVGRLTPSEIHAALASGVQMAELLIARNLIHSAALSLQGRTRVVAPPPTRISVEFPHRSLVHA
jgi:ApbE superfamily uncharacterized protein (UPF0280 family)